MTNYLSILFKREQRAYRQFDIAIKSAYEKRMIVIDHQKMESLRKKWRKEFNIG